MLTKKTQLKHNKKPRQKKCKTCKETFTPERPMQSTCGKIECAIGFAKVEKKKIDNKRKQEFKDNDKSHLLKVAQKEVNKYVRLRDKNEPCISCKTPNAKWDAGHYESQGGNLQQRFYTLNIWKQCYRCNEIMSSNRAMYRPALIEKLGIEKVEEIENDHSTKKYTVEYLQRLIKVFRKKIKLYETKFR